MATPRVSPGGASTVFLGSDDASWATISSAHGKGSAEAVAAAEPVTRSAPGGHDSISFGASDDPARPATVRLPCGGASTVILGGDSAEWTTNSSSHGNGSAEAVAAAPARMRPAVGGEDSISFGSDGSNAPTADELLSRPQTAGPTTIVLGGDAADWAAQSNAHGVGCVQAAAASEARVRPSPGGRDSIDFQDNGRSGVTAEELLARRPADGPSTVVLGSDGGEWGTNSSSLGAGSVEAIAAAEPRARVAPGGRDSVEFGKEAPSASAQDLLTRPSPGGCDSVSRLCEAVGSAPLAEELLARPSVGGADSIDFAAKAAPSTDRQVRAPPTGPTSVVLGADANEWTTNSASHGVGSAEAVAAAEPRARQAVGGVDSVTFGKDDGSALPAEELLARKPCSAGPSSVVLGCDGAAWNTTSSANGVGSAEAVAAAGPRVRTAVGGTDTVDFGGADVLDVAVEELLARPAVGGSDSVDFVSTSDAGLPAQELLLRPSVAGPATIVLGADGGNWATNSQAHGVGSAEAVAAAEPRARPPTGGVDSVSLGGGAPLARSSPRVNPTGAATVVLGADAAEWSKNSSILGTGSLEAIANAEPVARQAPGGSDHIDFSKDGGKGPSAEALLTRPSVGGADCIDLSNHASAQLASIESQAARAGPGGTMLKPSSRVHQAPGGTSSLVLGTYEEKQPAALVSSNCFANGSNQNAGNCMTGRSSTRLHHAPGGASTFSLAHDSSPVVLGENASLSSNAFANGANQNAGNVLTSRSTTRLRQAPGGTTTICLGDENVDVSNVDKVGADKINAAEPQKPVGPELAAAGARVVVLG